MMVPFMYSKTFTGSTKYVFHWHIAGVANMPAVFFFVTSVFNKAQRDSLPMRLGHTHQGEHKICKHLSLATQFTKGF